MKTGEDFKKQAKEKGINRWMIHNCSMCDYECGFYFHGDEVEYDNGCYCSRVPRSPRTWDDVADHYNMQLDYYEREKNPKTLENIKRMNKFWGFK